MKAIWSGAINFGLVNIPVKLYSAIQESRLDFDLLDKKDHHNVKYKRVNEKTGKEVPWANIVKGVKVKDKYVVLSKADFEKAAPEKTKQIQLESFVDLKEIDPILFKSAYYVWPDANGSQAFGLLASTIQKTGRCGIGRFVLRNRENLVLLRTADDVVLLHSIRFLSEIRSPNAYSTKKLSKKKPKPAELKMAGDLVKSMTDSFNLKDYSDTYTKALMKRIRSKASGRKIADTPTKRQIESGSLVEQLKKSIAQRKK